MEGAPLTHDQHSESSLAGAMKYVLSQNALLTENCLPAIVVGYDDVKNVATVRPAIVQSIKDADGKLQRRARQEIPDVPVLSIGAGGFHLHFPLNAGDLGWIVASDRDISLYLQSLSETNAGSQRTHSFADAVFVPDVMRKYTLNAEDKANVVLQSIDGSTRISVGADFIKITAPTTVTIDVPNAIFTGDVQVDGAVSVATTVVAGTSMVSPSMVIGGVEVAAHDHTIPTGTTGPMQ